MGMDARRWARDMGALRDIGLSGRDKPLMAPLGMLFRDGWRVGLPSDSDSGGGTAVAGFNLDGAGKSSLDNELPAEPVGPPRFSRSKGWPSFGESRVPDKDGGNSSEGVGAPDMAASACHGEAKFIVDDDDGEDCCG